MTHSKSILPSPFAHRFCAVDSRLVEVSGFGDGGGLGGAVVVGERVGGSVNRHFFYNKAEHFVHKHEYDTVPSNNTRSGKTLVLFFLPKDYLKIIFFLITR